MSDKKEINVEIGARLKYHRERAGLTQEQLAESLEMGEKSISAVERGTVGISLTTLQKICVTLSISADDLLFDTIHENDVTALTARLSKLTPTQFEVTNDIINKLIEALHS